MDDLIEALTTFRRYGNLPRPTWCERAALYVEIDPRGVSAEDTARLNQLGFYAVMRRGDRCFYSSRFGST